MQRSQAIEHETAKAHSIQTTDNKDDITIPPHMLTSNKSQDVFLVVTSDKKRIVLVPSKHSGHQFFKCLAELNRMKFTREFMQDASSRYTATLMVESLCHKGKGTIYVKQANSSNGDWRPVIQPRQATELIFRTLLTMYSVNTTSGTTTPPEQHEPPPPIVSPETTPTKLDERKRCHDSTMEAAEGLLLVRTASGEQKQNSKEERPPRKKRVRFAEDVEPRAKPCDTQFQVAKKKLKTLQQQHEQPHSSTGAGGIPITAITDRDVLCGESGQGLYNARNTGNLDFLALVDANVTEFYNGQDKRKMLNMAKLAVSMVHEAGGRFLVVNPTTGLWHEVKLEKAWSKALRTFQSYEQVAKQRSAIQSLREKHEKRNKAKQLSAVHVGDDSANTNS